MVGRGRFGGWRRVMSLVVVWVLAVTGSMVVSAEALAARAAQAERPEWVDDLAAGGGEAPEPVPWQESDPVPLLESEPSDPLPEPVFPEPGSYDVPLLAEGDAVGEAGGDSGPVALASDAAVGEELQIEVLDHSIAERLGVTGFVFGVSEAAAVGGDALLGEAAAQELPAEMAIDFSGFSTAYGGNFEDRLQVVALPPCALEDPLPADCNTSGVPLETRVDLTVDELVVSVDDLAAMATGGVDTTPRGELGLSAEELAAIDAGSLDESVIRPDDHIEAPEESAEPAAPEGAAAEPAEAALEVPAGEGSAVFAVTSGPSGETGNWGASPLNMAGDWQVTPGSGEFTYSYDMEVPSSAAGSAPSVGMGYSSGSVDGLTTGANTTSPQNGVGWGDFANGFIERRYVPCDQTVGTNDLCWSRHNGMISLNGVTGRLIPAEGSTTLWHVQGDPGWRVERLTGATNDDNDGEHWKVTTNDGTQYFFGLGRTPTNTVTDSVYTVPVLADNTGEPCRDDPAAVGSCDQGWRWNLDRVVDPNGNLTTHRYYREWNRYSAIGGLGDDELYTRGGRLGEINYGAHTSSPTPTARVTFGGQYRCNTLTGTGPTACTKPNQNATPTNYPDTPVDLICDTNCLVTTPTFFTSIRYSHVRTEVLVGTEWEDRDQYNLGHGFISNTDGDNKLYLVGLQRIGLMGDELVGWPHQTFWHFELPNRIDVNLSAGEKPMGHFRLGIIVNEYGGETHVDYGQNRPCTATYTIEWDDNVRDCFPGGPGSYVGSPNTDDGLFHKYLVEAVTEEARHGSPAMTTSYTYEGDPAWHFAYDPFIARNQFGQTVYGNWTNWRGYGTVSVTQGDSTTRTRVFRSMDGDWTMGYYPPGNWHMPVGNPVRDINVQSFDGTRTFPDSPAFAGRVLEEQALGTLDGVAEVPIESTLYEYDQQVTAEVTDNEAALDDATWSDLATVTNTFATEPDEFRQSRVQYGYNARFQTTSVLEEGWLDETGDERCALTTYAENTTAWMFTYPASIQSVAGDCSSTTVLSRSETYYDNSTTLGQLPTGARGNVTSGRTRIDTSTWSTTSTTYDALGRVLTATDPRGAVTTNTYTASPAHAIPTQTTVANDLGHTSTTSWDPEVGAPLQETDPNGNVTTYTYDELGRVETVRAPTEQPYAAGKPATMAYAYILDPAREDAPIVRTQQLTSPAATGPDVVLEDSWVLYDGLMRERQTQVLSPSAGKVIANATTYDGRGLVRDVTAPQAIASANPGTAILDTTWDNRTRTLYDELGRQSASQWWRGGAMAYETTLAYTEDTVTSSPPEGGDVRERQDGLGRTIAVEEHDGTDWQGSTYTHDLADRLTSVTDTAGNTIDYTYNMAGWQLTVDDPDRGTSSFAYDAIGRPIRVTDANNQQIHTIYDDLGRPTERREDSTTGTLLAEWDYDAPGQAGLLDRAIRHDPTGDWIADVTGYDARSRPTGTSLTVPAGIPALSGTYAFTQTYDAADRPRTVTYPAVGGLASETVTTEYNMVGQPTGLSGTADYVSAFAYDDRARPSAAAYGPQPSGQPWLAQNWTYDVDQRLEATETWSSTAAVAGGVVSSHEFGYDPNGNITNRATTLNGDSWRECYSYDARQRLVEAHTVDDADTCATGTAGEGDQPYEHTYDYSADGNLTERVEDGSTTTYTYPSSGNARPHAPTGIGGDAYTWDANGNLTERTVDGDTETYTWTAEQLLETVESPDDTTEFTYDAGGQRLLRQTDDGATLYLPSHEVHANTAGTTVTAVRTYSFGGGTVATRTPDGVSYLSGDQAGSAEMQIDSEDDVSATRAYTPYGNVRSETGDLATDRGFLGQVEDSTGLNYLNARYYDTTNGIFISPDPLYDTGRPRSQNPYAYAHGNPTTLSDPSGLWIPVSNSNSPAIGYDHRVNGGRGGFIGQAGADTGISRSLANSITNIQRQQRKAYKQSVQNNAQRRKNEMRRQHEIATMNAMCKANCDPGFWHALAAAGSGGNLVLVSMCQANCDPGFWKFMHSAGSAQGAKKIAAWAGRETARVAKGRRGNAIAHNFSSSGTGLAHSPCGPISSDYECVPRRGWVQAGEDNYVMYGGADITLFGGYETRISIRSLNLWTPYEWRIDNGTDHETISPGVVSWESVTLPALGSGRTYIEITSSRPVTIYDVWDGWDFLDYPWAQLRVEVYDIVGWETRRR